MRGALKRRISDIPECPWRFGEKYLATDFVMSQNIAIIKQAEALIAEDNDKFIWKTARWIRDYFFYPLDRAGNPSAQGQLLRHQIGFASGYHFKNCVYYAWSLPNEVIGATKCGICIDTANLAASILRTQEIDAWVVLGDVLSSKDDTLLGRHAWVEVPVGGTPFVMETTIHDSGVNNMIETKLVYDKTSGWAQDKGIYYLSQAKYNDVRFIGDGPLGGQMMDLIGLPAKRVLIFGLDRTKCFTARRLYKEWRQEEKLKTDLVNEAYRRS